jgi:hypothetical protein
MEIGEGIGKLSITVIVYDDDMECTIAELTRLMEAWNDIYRKFAEMTDIVRQ